MRIIRDRTKEHMPMVLLTLLSIVQALALELLWGHIGERVDLYEWGFVAFVGWLQVLVSLAGLILIWLVYSTTIMRFSWVPSIPDSVWPFVIGILEFMLISSLGPGRLAQWFILLTLLFTIMNVGNHVLMRRARLDADNAEFFAHLGPARFKDFIPHIGAFFGFTLLSAYFWRNDDSGWPALMALLFALCVISVHTAYFVYFWNQSISDPPATK